MVPAADGVRALDEELEVAVARGVLGDVRERVGGFRSEGGGEGEGGEGERVRAGGGFEMDRAPRFAPRWTPRTPGRRMGF
jgi:hypothetical protein